MTPEIASILADSPLFKNIPPEKILEMFRRVRHHTKEFRQGNWLVFRDRQCEELIITVKGTVRGEMTDSKGRSIEIESIPAPRPLAPAFIFGHHNRYPVDIVAMEPVLVVLIPKNSLLTLFQFSPQLLTNFLNAISSRAQFLSEKLWIMSFKTIRGKIASYVLNLHQPRKPTVKIPKNLQQLSEYFGVARPSLSRVFARLKHDHILEYHQGHITIINREKLVDLLDQD